MIVLNSDGEEEKQKYEIKEVDNLSVSIDHI